MRKWILLLALLLALPMAGGAEPWDEVIGQPAPDFEVICADGSRFCLSEALAERPLALVCVFGAGCGACRKELRALALAHRLYQDQVAVIALSLDRSRDTDEVLLQLSADLGLTFPLARDPVHTARFMKINMYPAFMIVDQTGAVACIEVNGPASIDHFVALFDSLLGAAPSESETLCAGDACPLPESL